jgi:hypothetical protein
MIVAHKTASFLWFESQKIIGRKEPWSPKVPVILQTSQPSKEEIDSNMSETKAENSGLLMPFLQPCELPATEPNNLMNSQKCDEDEKADNQPTDTENNIPMPTYSAPPKPMTNPDEIEKAEMTDHALLPQNPAPSQPDSINIDLPKRKIRKKLLGMEEDDPIGKSVAFLWWFFFLLSRILSLAACANLQPFATLGVLVVHYIIITSHLLHQTGFLSIYKVFIQLCLGYVFTFCFIEFRYKLKNVKVFYTCYFSLMLLENISMSLSWYLSEEWESFWYIFIFIIIYGSCAISFLSMALYFSILKPKVKVLYDE